MRRRWCPRRCSLRKTVLFATHCLVGAYLLVSRVSWPHDVRIYIPCAMLPRAPEQLLRQPSDQQDQCPRTRFEMLQLLTHWLVQNEISYFLTYGTLLGAVRGGGIISYTPDVDVGIPELWHPHVQQLFENELPDCFESGREGIADMPIVHLYSRSDEVERLPHRVLPIVKAEPWIDLYAVLLCSPDHLHPDEDGFPSKLAHVPGGICTEIIATGAVGEDYAYMSGLVTAVQNSRKDEGQSSVKHVPHMLYEHLHPINQTRTLRILRI